MSAIKLRIQVRFGIHAESTSCTKSFTCTGNTDSQTSITKINSTSVTNVPRASLSFSYAGLGIAKKNLSSRQVFQVKVWKNNSLLGSGKHHFVVDQQAENPASTYHRLRLYCKKLFVGSVDIFIIQNQGKQALRVSFLRCLELDDTVAPHLRKRRKPCCSKMIIFSSPAFVLCGMLLFYYLAFGTWFYVRSGSLTRPDCGIRAKIEEWEQGDLPTCNSTNDPERVIDDPEAGCAAHGIVDALYFLSVSLSTVGHGNIGPHTAEARGVASLVVLWGMCIIGVFVSVVSASVNDHSTSRYGTRQGSKSHHRRSCCHSRNQVVPLASETAANLAGDEVSSDIPPTHSACCRQLARENVALVSAILVMIVVGTSFYYLELRMSSSDGDHLFSRCLLYGVLSATTLGCSSEAPESLAGRIFASVYLPVALGVVCIALYSWVSMLHHRKPVGLVRLCSCCCRRRFPPRSDTYDENNETESGSIGDPKANDWTHMLAHFDYLTAPGQIGISESVNDSSGATDGRRERFILQEGNREQFILYMLLRHNKLDPKKHNCLAEQFRLLATRTPPSSPSDAHHGPMPGNKTTPDEVTKILVNKITLDAVKNLRRHMNRNDLPLLL